MPLNAIDYEKQVEIVLFFMPFSRFVFGKFLWLLLLSILIQCKRHVCVHGNAKQIEFERRKNVELE